MNVADTGLIMVSAKSGVEVGTEKAWEYCEEMHLPRIIFINQMDEMCIRDRQEMCARRSIMKPAVWSMSRRCFPLRRLPF